MANLAGRRQTGVVSAHHRAPGWLTRKIFNLEHQGGLLQDDATLLMVDWRPVNPSVAPLPVTE
jgi:hypothetical protein